VFAGESPKVLVKTFYVFHEGKAFVQIAAIQIPVNNLLQIGPPESVLSGEMIIIDPDEGLEIVLHSSSNPKTADSVDDRRQRAAT